MAMLVITRGYKLYNDSLDSSWARYPVPSGTTLGYPGLHLFDLLGEVNQGSREQGGLCAHAIHGALRKILLEDTGK